MNAKEFVDSLFAGYEETAALSDFKEELLGNLNAKIESLVKKGMEEGAAFEKASAELGDVSSLADDLSLKKRKEVFEEVYMDIRKYMPAARVAAYVVFGVLALFGIIAGFVTYFATRMELDLALNLTSSFGALMPFIVIAIMGFTYLGLTQETASDYPMSKKRAAWYALSVSLISFGITIMPVTYFSSKFAGTSFEVMTTIAILIPFVLPGGGLLAFLVLTEKDRLKPWAKEFRAGVAKREMAMWNDPATATRFGMFSGAIWIFAVGLFILLGFALSFKFSWLVFVFAVAIQLLVQGIMSKNISVSGKN
ncbi:hypothetical protein AGMMS50293_25190 [Spirochaetia bacterium]|nr:hypothetical protein AGMMS50293_25190 [Spirochaetia bacterium]